MPKKKEKEKKEPNVTPYPPPKTLEDKITTTESTTTSATSVTVNISNILKKDVPPEIDIVKECVDKVRQIRYARGVVDNILVELFLGYVQDENKYGWQVICRCVYGSSAHRAGRVFAEKKDAEKYFEELVKKYNLKEVEP